MLTTISPSCRFEFGGRNMCLGVPPPPPCSCGPGLTINQHDNTLIVLFSKSGFFVTSEIAKTYAGTQYCKF